MEEKRKGLEEERKCLLVQTPGELELALVQQKMWLGEVQVTKEWLVLPLFQLALRKDEKTSPHCLESKALDQQSRCLDFEAKRKEQEAERNDDETKRKRQVKMTK